MRLGALAAGLLLLTGCGGAPPPAIEESAPTAEPAAPAGPVDLALPAAEGSLAPWLAVGEDGSLQASWLDPLEDGGHAMRHSVLGGDRWRAPRVLVADRALLANWADPPTFRPAGAGLIATWPLRRPEGGHAYDLLVGAASRFEPGPLEGAVRPHSDDTATEHGFGQAVALPSGGHGVLWLDGRDYATAKPEEAVMTLRFARLDAQGRPQGEEVLDERTCDCCPLAAVTTDEALLVAYRDRSDGGEIRDIALVRHEAGRWSEPRVVHADGWKIAGCPVNGPALAAAGPQVVLAWFTAPAGEARVLAAVSRDGGRSFAEPVRLDGGAPAGRVTVAMLPGGDAAVGWLEGDHLVMRRLTADGRRGPTTEVAPVAPGRSGGMPRLVAHAGGLVAAWTEGEPVQRVRAARLASPAR